MTDSGVADSKYKKRVITIEYKIDNSDALDVLNYLLENDKIDLSCVQEKIKMINEEKILKMHVYKVWEGTDGKWRTYLPDSTKSHQRRLVKRNSKKDIDKAIIQYYRENDLKSFRSRFEIWKQRQIDMGVSDNTVVKYESDYRRFVKGSQIEHMQMDQITEDMLGKLFSDKAKELNPPYKTLMQFYSMINNVFAYSVRQKIIEYNVCEYLDIKILKKYCNEKQKTAETRTLSDEEMILLYYKLEENHIRNPLYIASYAVQFAMFTGMRVGEIAALKWEDIDYHKKVIKIQHSEIRNRKTKEYHIGKTKTGKERNFPLTDEIESLLQRVKKEELKYGFLTEFVFSDENGRIHADKISDCATDKARQAGIKGNKSVHAIRRTLNSKLIFNNVPKSVTSSLLGNTEQVNMRNYTYDVSNMDYKSAQVSRIGKELTKSAENY